MYYVSYVNSMFPCSFEYTTLGSCILSYEVFTPLRRLLQRWSCVASRRVPTASSHRRGPTGRCGPAARDAAPPAFSSARATALSRRPASMTTAAAVASTFRRLATADAGRTAATGPSTWMPPSAAAIIRNGESATHINVKVSMCVDVIAE